MLWQDSTVRSIEMTINDKIRHENLQYNINKAAAKISALSSVKTGKYVYRTG